MRDPEYKPAAFDHGSVDSATLDLPRDESQVPNMTMPNERTRAVIETGEFLLELSRDSSLPERIRRDAKFLLRHYPTRFQVLLAGQIEETSDSGISPMGPVFGSSNAGSYHSPVIHAGEINRPDEWLGIAIRALADARQNMLFTGEVILLEVNSDVVGQAHRPVRQP